MFFVCSKCKGITMYYPCFHCGYKEEEYVITISNTSTSDKFFVENSPTLEPILKLINLGYYPHRINYLEEGTCYEYKHENKKLYLELYNDGEIGYIIEDFINKEILENEDIYEEEIIPCIQKFFKGK